MRWSQSSLLDSWHEALVCHYVGTPKSLRCHWDLIFVTEAWMFPLADRIQRRWAPDARIVVEFRDVWVGQDEAQSTRLMPFQERFVRLVSHHAPRVDAAICVSDGHASLLEQISGVSAHVVLSTPDYHDLEISPPHTFPLRMIYHGVIEEQRGLLCALKVVERLQGRVTLDIVKPPFQGLSAHESALRTVSASIPWVSWRKGVPGRELIPLGSQYDIGWLVYPPSNQNIQTTLPNKLFEYVQSRLAVIVGPSPDASRLLSDYDCGILSPGFDPDSIVATLDALTIDDICRLRRSADQAARALCWEIESAKMQRVIRG